MNKGSIMKIEIVWVYILKGENGKHYTGITNNFTRRILEHKNGQSRSTRNYGKLTIEWLTECRGRREARRLEVLIKRKGAGQFLKTYGGRNKKQDTAKQIERSKKYQGIKIRETSRKASRSSENS
jgi:predicted GIY-YIG superfamily endonuclease